VIRAINKTAKMLIRDLILWGTNGIISIPDNTTIRKAIKSRPINSLPPNTIIR